MENKKSKVIVVCVIVFVLLLALIAVGILLINNNNKNIEMENDNREQIQNNLNNIPKEKLGLDTVSKINIIYNYDPYFRADAKIELAITGEQATNLIKLLKNYEYPDRNNLYLAIAGEYQIVLSNGVEFLFDASSSKDGTAICIINGEKTLTVIPTAIQTVVMGMVNTVLENNAKIYETDTITIKKDNKEIIVNDKFVVDNILEKCKYLYEIEKIENQNILCEIVFNENTRLQIYEDEISAKLIYNESEKYLKRTGELYWDIEIIINNYFNNLLETLNTNSIIIEQNGKKAEITDTKIINDIITLLNYSKINYDSLIDYENLMANMQEYDITLTLDNVKIHISAFADGIVGGTSGRLIYPNQNVHLIYMGEEIITYIENLIKQVLK